MYRQNYGLGSLASTVLRNNLGPIGIPRRVPSSVDIPITPLMSGMSTPQTTRYGRKYGLSLPMVDYLNAPLPDISGLFAPLAGTAPAVDVPIEDVTEDQILQAIAAQDYYNQINQGGGGDGSDVFNVRPGDPNIRFPDQYSPYAYRRSMAEPGTVAPSPSYFYPPKPGILSMVPYVGAITKAADAISDILPVNPRAIKENELLGAGVALDPIGRVVQTGDYLDPTNVMAGYNAAKITDETVDERIETINESLNKFDKYDPFSPSYDPEATQYQLDKIKALEEFKTDILDPSTEKTKNILQSEYETDPKYQFTGPNVQGDFKTTNNVVDVPGMFSNLTGPSGDPYGGGIGGVQTNFLNSLPEGGAIAMPDYSNVTGIMGPPVEISGPQITGPTIKTPQRLDDELFNITGMDIGNLSEELFGSPKTDTFLDNAYVSAGNIMTDGIMSSSQAQAIAAEEAAARAREEAAERSRQEAAAQAARESAIAQEAANREAAREAAAAAAAARSREEAAQAARDKAIRERDLGSGPPGIGGGGGGGGDGCFLKGTLVTMLDGSKKEIEKIDLGDEVAKGGKVFATGKFLVNNLYDYRGIKVSGSHMVFEEGNWTRVEDSKYGKALGDEEHTVYVFGCENRRILIEDILFTDYFEVKDQDKLIEDKEKFFDSWKTFANNEDRKNVNTLNAN